mmetsp:Transcript_34076/g.42095  ORF Transcript_34076/g.42095 Transcript_34076/m.42095 type:complete len:206 (-) Transcript_34076:596-1213(-)
MVAASAEGLLSANGDFVGVQQISEEFPASGSLVASEAELLADVVKGSRGRHTAGRTRDTTREVRDPAGLGHYYSNAIRGGHKEVLAEDHVPVGVAIASCCEVRSVLSGLVDAHRGDEVSCIRQIGVGVTTAEVGKHFAAHELRGIDAKLVDEDLAGVGASNAMHAIEADAEVAALQEGANLLEVEKLLHEGHIGLSVIDDFYDER